MYRSTKFVSLCPDNFKQGSWLAAITNFSKNFSILILPTIRERKDNQFFIPTSFFEKIFRETFSPFFACQISFSLKGSAKVILFFILATNSENIFSNLFLEKAPFVKRDG